MLLELEAKRMHACKRNGEHKDAESVISLGRVVSVLNY
jgi:hypothetical protein